MWETFITVFLVPLFVSFLTVLFERWLNNRDK